MERIHTVEVSAHVGERVRIAGWLHSLRRLGGVSFLVVRDGWGIVQVVAETEAELGPLQDGVLGVESIVAVEGVVVSEAQAPGGIELHQPRIEVLVPVTEVPPVSLNKRKISASLGTLLDHAVVTNRHLARRAVLRLAAGAMAGFRSRLSARGFTEIQTPKIVAGATEKGAKVFKMDYFGRAGVTPQKLNIYILDIGGVFYRGL